MVIHAPHVVLMCGPAGAGKTTYARQLEATGFVRLSIDEEVWRRIAAGTLAPQFDEERVKGAIELDLRGRLVELLTAGRDVVVDLSFWARRTRDLYRRIVTENGGTVELVYLRVPADELHERVARRNRETHANAVTVDRETLERYIAGFEEPGEDEQPTVIEVVKGGR